MMETLLSRSIRAICLGGMTLGMTAAIAQEASAPLQRVEVTGSRIRQVDLETAQPIQVMNSEQIQKSGLVTVGDVLNNLSSAGTPSFGKGGSLTSNNENGGQYINLRNLGAQRLLVLVDGKRWTQTVNGYTDMSTIPSAMIERIEVLKDGASSIYGSDAIAGVVNIILKRNMQGGQLSLYTGQNEKNDGKNKDFSLTYGAGDDKASLMFGLSHTEQGAVFTGTRGRTAYQYGPAHPYDRLGAGPWGRIAQVDPLTGGESETGFNKMLNHTGNWNGIGTGADSRNQANYHDYMDENGVTANEDKYNSSQDMHLTMPNKLDTLFVKGEIALPKDMRLKTTAMYSQRSSTAQIAGYPVDSLSQQGYPVYIDKDSYYNPYGSSVVGAGAAQDLFFTRRTTELKRITENENRTLHIDATLEGEFDLRGNPWNWSVGYNHSATKGTITGTGNINLLNLKKALGPSFMNSAGTVQCGTPDAPIALNECTPWDILGGPSASTPEALAYVNSTGQSTYGSTINSATADISGELFSLPAGNLGFAAGIEHREVRGSEIPGQFEQSGYSTDLSGNPTYGRYTVREAYAELNVPVLKNQPFAELLSFNLATRHSDYSNFGVTNNSKISFMYKPVKDVLARGTWAEGFRAPSLGDTFGGGSQTFDTFLDPCDTQFGEAASNAAVLERCMRAGTTANFRQQDKAKAPITSTAGVQSIVAFNSGEGNDSLSPETATTRTLGLVYSPSFIPGFSVSVDWYNIRVNNRITDISAEDLINKCYVENVTSFCSSLGRNADGQLNSLSRGNLNLGKVETEGYDLSLTYRLPRTAYGQFTLRNDTSYIDKFLVQADATAAERSFAGQYDSDYGALNRVKSNTSLDWNLGNWSATWTARYYSQIKDRCYNVKSGIECSLPTYRMGNGSTGANELGSLVYHDLSVGYRTSWEGRILAGVNNVFDKGLRTVYNTSTSAVAIDSNLPLDRFFYVRYTQNF